MRNLLNRWTVKSAVVLGLSLAATGIASAQATAAGGRSAEVAPFFQATSITPDWGSEKNFGYAFGVDYTRLTRGVGSPALEFRMTRSNGLRVDENTFAGGFKLVSYAYGFYPYATFLIGRGTINIHPGGPSLATNSGMMYTMGGGADFRVRPNIKLRADFTQQNWSFAPHRLTPVALSIGVSYTLPFGQGGISQ